MSLSIYSAQSAEANRLKFGEFEIYYDREQDKVIIKTGRDQVYFNSLYNKDEVDQLIAQGVDPSSFEEWIFNRVMLFSFATGSAVGVVSLKELLNYLSRDMQALNVLMNGKVDSSNVVAFDAGVEPTEKQIYNASSMYETLREALTTNDLVLWNQDLRPEHQWNVYNAQSLWDKITSIKECHCDPNLMDFLRQLKQISTIDPPTAIGNLKSFVLNANIKAAGMFMSSNYPVKSAFVKRPDLPNEEEVNGVDKTTLMI